MNTFNLIKRLILSAVVIFYAIVSLLLCYVFLSDLAYAFSFVSITENGMEIIRGIDAISLLIITRNVLQYILFILFVLLSIATVFLLTVSMFKKRTSRKLSILLCVFPMLSLLVFIVIPTQIYVVSLYVLIRQLPFIKLLLEYIHIFYIVLSFVIIEKNILFSMNGCFIK